MTYKKRMALFLPLLMVILLAGCGEERRNEKLLENVAEGNTEAVSKLISRGADVNSDNGRALLRAVESKQPEMCRILVEAGADVNIQNGRALIRAVELEQPEICSILLDAGANPDVVTSSGIPILGRAVRRGYLDIVKMLLDAGADVNIDNGRLLIKAIESNQPGMYRMLLDAGVDPDLSYNGKPPLQYAIDRNDDILCEALLSAGADSNVYFEEEQEQAFNYAARVGQSEIFSLLYHANGGQLQDSLMDAALISAVENNTPEMVQLILSYGADPNAISAEGKSVIEYAVEREDPFVSFFLYNLLRKARADSKTTSTGSSLAIPRLPEMLEGKWVQQTVDAPRSLIRIPEVGEGFVFSDAETGKFWCGHFCPGNTREGEWAWEQHDVSCISLYLDDSLWKVLPIQAIDLYHFEIEAGFHSMFFEKIDLE